MPLLYETYAISETKTIRVVAPEIGPWLVTFRLSEYLTNKPIEGVVITVDTGEVGTTTADGTVTLTLTGGERTLRITKNGYWPKTTKVMITEDTTIDLKLLPIWIIAAGGIGASATILLALWAITRKRT